MRKSIIFILSLLFVVQSDLLGQVNFSKSIDLGQSSNYSTGIYNDDGSGILILNSLNFCPEPGFVSCGGVIVYNSITGEFYDALWSEYPDNLHGSGKSAIVKLSNNYIYESAPATRFFRVNIFLSVTVLPMVFDIIGSKSSLYEVW